MQDETKIKIILGTAFAANSAAATYAATHDPVLTALIAVVTTISPFVFPDGHIKNAKMEPTPENN